MKELERVCCDIFGDGTKLRIQYGDNNSIKLHEEVMAIDDYYWVVEATLTNESQFEWLSQELSDPNFSEWDTSSMYLDRISVNERYGFSSDHLR